MKDIVGSIAPGQSHSVGGGYESEGSVFPSCDRPHRAHVNYE
ncbi:MAG TPA: hypothetical protein VLA84_03765 [Microcoleus sp.]|nr:hypothetical protein [Microcoleus sp.]